MFSLLAPSFTSPYRPSLAVPHPSARPRLILLFDIHDTIRPAAMKSSGRVRGWEAQQRQARYQQPAAASSLSLRSSSHTMTPVAGRRGPARRKARCRRRPRYRRVGCRVDLLHLAKRLRWYRAFPRHPEPRSRECCFVAVLRRMPLLDTIIPPDTSLSSFP